MLPDFKTQTDFQRRIIVERQKAREMERLKLESEEEAAAAPEAEVAEEEAQQEDSEDEEDEYEDDEAMIAAKRRPRMSRTERFGMTILLGLFSLVGLLALDVAGVPVVRMTKRAVVRMLRPHAKLDVMINPNASEGQYDDVVVLPRGD